MGTKGKIFVLATVFLASVALADSATPASPVGVPKLIHCNKVLTKSEVNFIEVLGRAVVQIPVKEVDWGVMEAQLHEVGNVEREGCAYAELLHYYSSPGWSLQSQEFQDKHEIAQTYLYALKKRFNVKNWTFTVAEPTRNGSEREVVVR